jgi:hypothetical protein
MTRVFRKDKNTPKLSALFLAESCPISFPGTSMCQHQTIDLQFSEGDIDLDCGRSSSVVVKGRRNPEIRGTPGSQPTKTGINNPDLVSEIDSILMSFLFNVQYYSVL